MTSLQALKVNSDLAQRIVPDAHLSPRQLELLEQIRAQKVSTPIMIDQDFVQSWNNTVLSKS